MLDHEFLCRVILLLTGKADRCNYTDTDFASALTLISEANLVNTDDLKGLQKKVQERINKAVKTLSTDYKNSKEFALLVTCCGYETAHDVYHALILNECVELSLENDNYLRFGYPTGGDI